LNGYIVSIISYVYSQLIRVSIYMHFLMVIQKAVKRVTIFFYQDTNYG